MYSKATAVISLILLAAFALGLSSYLISVGAFQSGTETFKLTYNLIVQDTTGTGIVYTPQCFECHLPINFSYSGANSPNSINLTPEHLTYTLNKLNQTDDINVVSVSLLTNSTYFKTIDNITIGCTNKTLANGTTTECISTNNPYQVQTWKWSWQKLPSTVTLDKGKWYVIDFVGRRTPRVGSLATDIIPSINSVSMPEFAWWNSSYGYKRQEQINQSTGANQNLIGFPYLVNGIGITSLDQTCTKTQWLWGTVNLSTTGNTTNYLYYNSCSDYALANGTENKSLPLDVDDGFGSSYLPTSVWTNGTDAYTGVWHFKEGTGTSVADASGTGNTLSATGATAWITNSSCKFGNCSYFNNDLYFDITSSTNLDATDKGFTAEAWVYRNGSLVGPDGCHVFGKNNYGGSARGWSIIILVSDNTWHGRFSVGATTNSITTTEASRLNTWEYVALVYNTTHLTFYLNGTEVKTSAYSGTPSNSTSAFAIGKQPDQANRCQNVMFDELRFSPFWRSPGWIKRSYEQELARLLAEENLYANETGGRISIEQGIKNSLGNDVIVYTDQQVYVRYLNTSQQLARFDKVTRFGNQIWTFNYMNDTVPFTNMQNITPAFYVFEIANRTTANIVLTVSNFINQTKVS